MRFIAKRTGGNEKKNCRKKECFFHQIFDRWELIVFFGTYGIQPQAWANRTSA